MGRFQEMRAAGQCRRLGIVSTGTAARTNETPVEGNCFSAEGMDGRTKLDILSKVARSLASLAGKAAMA